MADDGALAGLADAELDEPVAEHRKLVRGTFENGASYVILPNTTPPDRVQVYLQVRVGSLNEEDDQQGIAHYLEHVVFLGTERYETSEKLRAVLSALGMSFGGDSNAFTDFRQTVYTLCSPTRTGEEEDAVAVCVDVLHQLAFRALIEEAAVEGERGAILSEVAMRNTIDNRISQAMFRQQHPETPLPGRFPIGLPDLISRWSAADLRAFYRRWYVPENMTLVVVGAVEPGAVVEHARALFGAEPAGRPGPAWPMPRPDWGAAPGGAAPRGHAPVRHRFGGLPPAPLALYESELLKACTAYFAVKLPMAPLRTRRDLLWQIVDTALGMALEARVEELLQGGADGEPCPLQSLQWSFTDCPREACAVNNLTVTALPRDWKAALRMAVREAVRLAEHGLTESELDHCLRTFMKEAELAAEQDETLDSEDLVDGLLADLEGGSCTMDRTETLAQYRRLLPRVTLPLVNRRARLLYGLVAAFPRALQAVEGAGAEAAAGEWGVGEGLRAAGFPLPDPAAEGDYYLASPPILFVYGPPSDSSPAADGPKAEAEGEEEDEEDEEEEGEGEGRGRPADFTREAVAAVVAEAVAEGAAAPVEARVPEHLVEPEALDRRIAAAAPAFVPIPDPRLSGPAALPDVREEAAAGLPGAPAGVRYACGVTGAALLQLSNGLRVNYKRTEFERRQVQMRLASPGGRALERDAGQGEAEGPGLEASAAVAVGVRSIVEGAAGGHAPEVVSKWCAVRGIAIRGGTDTERLCVSLSCSVTDGGVERALELLHAALSEPALHGPTFARIVREELLGVELLQKSVERLALNEMFAALTEPPADGRLVALERAALEALTPDACLRAVRRHLPSLELCVVGDFEPAALELALLRYLGSLPLPPAAPPLAGMRRAIAFRAGRAERRRHIVDAENERAVVAVAFPSASKWGEAPGVAFPPFAPAWAPDRPAAPPPRPPPEPWADPAAVRNHPLYVVRVLTLCHELVNNRLYKEVREKKSLLYSASLSTLAFEFLQAGVSYFLACAFPDRIPETLAAVLAVLADLREAGPTEEEMAQALRPLVETCRTALSTNDFVMTLLTHLHTAGSRKDLAAVRFIPEFYQALTREDVLRVLRAYLPADPAATAIAIVTSGPAPRPAP